MYMHCVDINLYKIAMFCAALLNPCSCILILADTLFIIIYLISYRFSPCFWIEFNNKEGSYFPLLGYFVCLLFYIFLTCVISFFTVDASLAIAWALSISSLLLTSSNEVASTGWW